MPEPAIVRALCRFHPHLAEDIRAEAALAALEGVPEDGLGRRLNRFVRAFRRRHLPRPEPRYPDVGIPSAAASARPARSRMTAGQRRRFRRNVVIQAAARQGCSICLLVEVFGLTRPLVAAILAKDLGAIARRAIPATAPE